MPRLLYVHAQAQLKRASVGTPSRCVIGVKDPRRIQKVKAFIVPADGVEPGEELKSRIMEQLTLHIAKYALPREIEFRKELPKTLVGKVAFRVLEQEEENKISGNEETVNE